MFLRFTCLLLSVCPFVLVERVYEERPHDMSTTTYTTQPQGLALCSRCHLAWASEAPQWVPARTPTVHGHARIWPNRIWPKPHLAKKIRIWPICFRDRIWPELVFQSVDRIWPNRIWPILVF